GQVALAQGADVALAPVDVLRGEDGAARQRALGDHHLAVQADLRRHEQTPGRAALATDPHGNAAHRLGRAFQAGDQRLVAGRHAQTRVEAVDLDLVAPGNT